MLKVTENEKKLTDGQHNSKFDSKSNCKKLRNGNESYFVEFSGRYILLTFSVSLQKCIVDIACKKSSPLLPLSVQCLFGCHVTDTNY